MGKKVFILMSVFSIFLILTACSNKELKIFEFSKDKVTKIIISSQMTKKPIIGKKLEDRKMEEFIDKLNNIKAKKNKLPDDLPKGWGYLFKIENNNKIDTISIMNDNILINEKEYYKVDNEKSVDFSDFFIE